MHSVHLHYSESVLSIQVITTRNVREIGEEQTESVAVDVS